MTIVIKIKTDKIGYCNCGEMVACAWNFCSNCGKQLHEQVKIEEVGYIDI